MQSFSKSMVANNLALLLVIKISTNYKGVDLLLSLPKGVERKLKAEVQLGQTEPLGHTLGQECQRRTLTKM